MALPPEEQRNREDSPTTKEMLHKTKLIQFLGRTTPIILQNDNGPCPLLAICNVLLLRNNLNLSSDVAEVSQEKLLSLVADRLIDSNSNVNNKDTGYVENQQQNIADAIDLLPRLTTGIDVNIKFTRIHDFEFTRECAIFDLLDIPLYHGWIVDPQDSDTSSAIGLKSYNTLMGELVALETQNPASGLKNSEEDSVDFVAATTASLGVPSPSLSRDKSFDDSPRSVSEEKKERKGDLEEEEELLRALKLSESESSPTANDVNVVNTVGNNLSECSSDSYLKKQEPAVPGEVHMGAENDELCPQKPSTADDNNTMNYDGDLKPFEIVPRQEVCSSSQSDNDKLHGQIEASSEKHDSKDEIEKASIDVLIKSEKVKESLDESDLPPPVNTLVHNSGDEKIQGQAVLSNDVNVVGNVESAGKTLDVSCSSAPIAGLESSKDMAQPIDDSKSLTSNADGNEPIYEGEEHIQETSTVNYENREPMYEGEVVLAEQVDKVSGSADETKAKDGITPQQGELIRNFLKNSASQLTIYGLFSLQEGLKERELCVFFRNNHFNTMFKFEGELYLLATDQGYINQPDLVWEKLNEVNGDTVFMTSNFKEFNAENHDARSWDEQNALANTAEYLSSIDNAAQENTSFNSDLQLAIALQQQEFEQQQQQQQAPPQRNLPQPNTSGEAGLVTGPQPSRPRNSSSSSSKQESKSSKEKCIVM
ncbi:ubiquitin carboxyl-terminal hydrolase MINDY-1 isoform X2 [Cynara cardunculus var. scolymus]|uniref:ubiquitin carboxyl-terminal hydrolase MINDY-1 isoform X2 n=1 Tax=Cynara cardunculus var. scolymus TaxID=59895 RepID=UPI000D62D94D|nr:ubiquitin carboxyl-terminal hydrolase MINDY-1 isoform X2 [Cynara cardunculus var. scolymus]